MSTPLRALIIEDSEDDTALLVRELERGDYQADCRRVDTADTLDQALDDQPWDIVFADYTMPGFSGIKALSMIRNRGLDMPFIFVSGTIGEDKAVSAMKAGAQDYITKGNLKRLLPVVERELREAENRRQQRRSEQELNLLQSIIQHAAYAGDMYSALRITLGMIHEITGWPMAQVWLPNAEGTLLESSSVWHCRDKELEVLRALSMGRSFALGEGLPGRVWRSRQPEWLQDIRTGARFQGGVDGADKIAAIAVPVLAGDEVVAVMEFFTYGVRESDTRSIRFVSAVAVQLGGIIQRKRAEERLYFLAHYDDLTGLPNRVLFLDRLKQALVEANRDKQLVGVMFIDLDRFKAINDSLGHRIGDLFLKAVSERIVSCVREGDTVSRLAGDEFTLILRGINHVEDTARVAQKILDAINRPFDIEGQEVFASASIGVAIYPDDEMDVERLLRNADMAMYRAKERGGNTCEFYDADMTFKAQAVLALDGRLRHALERDEFELYYQPVVDLGEGTINGVEALIRWHRTGDGELVLPEEFISTAEETGLITAIGDWALHTACRQIQSRGNDAARRLRVAVNVSPRQFASGRILESTIKTLDETGFDPTRLNIEITETMLMQNTDVVLDVMHRLGKLGIRFSVDDFGTGYASLNYLKSYPINQVKIDKSFLKNVPGNANDEAIVNAIISMAHSMGITIIAEGVETKEQMRFLREHGCNAVQGFYFSPPVTLDVINRYLSEGKVLAE
jgi:diguanylate cyclase (GGDEF)-like protein